MSALAQALVLAFARYVALLRVQPLLRAALPSAWWALAAMTAAVLVLREGVVPGPARSLDAFVLALVLELVLGTVVGVVVALPAQVLVGAASVPAALLRVPAAGWTALVIALVSSAAFAMGLHHAVLAGASTLQQVFPLGEARAWWLGAHSATAELVAIAHATTLLALALASPSLLVAAAVELVGAAAARSSAEAAAFAAAPVALLRLAAVLIALGASWAIDMPRWASAALPSVPATVP
ncbi:MAG: hypothetical protein IPH07_12030 [Deltaproteobacteria bacterium]|nr:hypothetical protein [Deltaproteobacteria bacterium]MBP7291576.1 hypothetical protein [Nannocystaceae bacterium]